MTSFSQSDDYENNRFEIRKKYIELEQTLDDGCSFEIINHTLSEADKLLPRIQAPTEARLDSSLLQKCGSKMLQAIQQTESGTQYHFLELANKLIDYAATDIDVEGNESQGLTAIQWSKYGQALRSSIKPTSNLNFLYGTFDLGEVQVKEKRKRKQNVKETFEEAIRPSQLSSKDDLEETEDTPQEVTHIYDCFCEAYKKNGRNSIPYFKFLVHPTEFGITIENMFYFSFLFKDNLAKSTLKDGHIHMIEPVPEEEMNTLARQEKRVTSALTLSVDDWKRFVELYDITKPMIPERRKKAS